MFSRRIGYTSDNGYGPPRRRARPARNRFDSIAFLLILMFVILSFTLGGCAQPVVTARHPVSAEFVPVSGSAMPNGNGARLRVGIYELARLRASVATRRWPLMDSHTLSHRFEFELTSDSGPTPTVRCLLISVSGDEARDRTSMECLVSGDVDWQVRLHGRRALSGALTGAGREYAVRPSQQDAAQRAAYEVFGTDTTVAGIPSDPGSAAWIAQQLEAADRDAVAATVVALLVGRELSAGGL